MAKISPLCCLLLCFLLLLINSRCSARNHKSRQENECSISRLTAQRPSNRIQSEAGVTEVFDHNNEQFQCAGAAVGRYTIEPNGLLLPSYVNAPQLMYVVQGRGLQGVMVTGCPETFQSFQESQEEQQQGREQQGQQGQQGREQGQQGQQGQQGHQQEEQGQQGKQQEEQGREQGQQFQGDQHQKIQEIEEGDVFAVPTGFGHYIYNNGNRRLIVVSVLDISNEANQLDFQPRRFYLAGNPQNEFQQQGQQQQEQQQGQGQGQEQQEGREGQQQQEGQEQQQQGKGNNIFSGFDAQRLAEAFNVDVQLIRKLQGQNDRRGNIVRVEGGLQAVLPPRRQQEQEEQQQDLLYAQGNGYEETICSLRLRQNIGDPRRADVYTPRGGHRSSVTSYDLPVLRRLVKLSAHKGHLYQGAVMLPYYNVNANSIIYVVRGSARIEVVQHQGQTVANEEVQQGQVFVIPQNFVAMIKARDSGFEYVAIKTDENAIINTLAGNLSLMRAMPVQVIASAYQTSNNQAKQLKYNRQESTIGPPGGGSRSEYKASA